MRANSARGFTLFELLIAITVLGIIALFSLQAFNFLSDTARQVKSQGEALSQVQKAWLFIERDLRFGEAQSQGVGSNNAQQSIIAEGPRMIIELITFYPNPVSERKQIYKIQYVLDKGVLLRFAMPGGQQQSEQYKQTLLREVSDFSVEYQQSSGSKLLQSVSAIINHKTLGRFERKFYLGIGG